MGTYVPFNLNQFEQFLRDSNIPFVRRTIPGTYEHVFDIPVVGKSGTKYPATVRIHSSIQLGEDMTREVGDDAVRITVLRSDKTNERFPDGLPVKEIKYGAFRTKNCFTNTRERVRLAYGQAMRQSCPNCGTLMMKRVNKRDNSSFYGCSNYRYDDPNSCKAVQSVAWVEKGER